MKKRIAAIFAAFAIAINAGCGNTPAQTTAAPAPETAPAAAETEAVTADTTASGAPRTEDMSPEQIRKLTVNNSLLHIGSTERFRKAFDKAKNGEEITVAYIGGSITEGYTLVPDQCWAYLTHRWLCEKYPDAKINYVNAGLSGTPSTLGLIRAERDVIEPCGEPDIVFIEFAVNDAQSSVDKEAYECLVRKMLTLGSEPAVALLFMRTDNGYSCQSQQSQVGLHYNLPMISLNDALTLAIDEGQMTWEDYSNDGAHPNPEGSKLVAEMVELMLDVQAGEASGHRDVGDEDIYVDAADTEPLFGGKFVDMHLLDGSMIQPQSMGEYSEKEILTAFPNGWARKGGENEGIKFEMMFDDLFIVYHCNKNKRFGIADVYVDGEKTASVNSWSADGWSNPVPQLIMRGNGEMKHTVEIRMQDGQEDNYFGILAFGYTD